MRLGTKRFLIKWIIALSIVIPLILIFNFPLTWFLNWFFGIINISLSLSYWQVFWINLVFSLLFKGGSSK